MHGAAVNEVLEEEKQTVYRRIKEAAASQAVKE